MIERHPVLDRYRNTSMYDIGQSPSQDLTVFHNSSAVDTVAALLAINLA